ncbi:hypothetical protein [Bacillus mycoides]
MVKVADITYSEQVYWQQLWHFVITVALKKKLAAVRRFMVSKALFYDVDVALTWHLGTENEY